jgi:hypothetical protein
MNSSQYTYLLAALLALTTSAHAIDANGDGMDDVWQALYNIAPFTGVQDPDGDGRPNLVESMNWTNPNDAAHPDAGWGYVMMTDHNGDKIDDGWAGRYFPQGMVFNALTDPPATSPANGIYSDPDGDGRTNLEESIVGSDPFVADVPWQRLGSPLPATGPGEFTLNFRSIVTGSYVVQKSTDLINWNNAGSPFWGDGLSKSITVNTGTAPSMFFRVLLQQTNGGPLDSDHDNLPDWYEINIFHTDPNNADTDGDGIPDGWEVANGHLPLNPGDGDPIPSTANLGNDGIDSDGDGVPDWIEVAAGSNPNDVNSVPSSWDRIRMQARLRLVASADLAATLH